MRSNMSKLFVQEMVREPKKVKSWNFIMLMEYIV